MKIRLHLNPAGKHRRSERGFAVFVVLVLLVAMAALTIGNNVALGQLQRELHLIESRQVRRSGAIVATNQPVLRPSASPFRGAAPASAAPKQPSP